jgi:hypothetical protein
LRYNIHCPVSVRYYRFSTSALAGVLSACL